MPYVTGQLVALYFRGSMYSLYIDYPEERKEEGNAPSRNASIMQSCPDYLTTADHTFSLCNFSQLPYNKIYSRQNRWPIICFIILTLPWNNIKQWQIEHEFLQIFASSKRLNSSQWHYHLLLQFPFKISPSKLNLSHFMRPFWPSIYHFSF